MKKILLIIHLFLGCQLCFAQKYTFTSNWYKICSYHSQKGYEAKDYVQYSTVVVDLNKLMVEIHRKDKTFFFKIQEMKYRQDGGRNFKCVDITEGQNLNCMINLMDMSPFGDTWTNKLSFGVSYDNLNRYTNFNIFYYTSDVNAHNLMR